MLNTSAIDILGSHTRLSFPDIGLSPSITNGQFLRGEDGHKTLLFNPDGLYLDESGGISRLKPA
jgi:hypothetical protein